MRFSKSGNSWGFRAKIGHFHQILSDLFTGGAHVIHDGPVIVCPEQRAREDDGVEGHVVLRHEVVQLNLKHNEVHYNT